MEKTDPNTGISMVWAVDSYPNGGNGGIRISDITREFARPFIKKKVKKYYRKIHYKSFEEFHDKLNFEDYFVYNKMLIFKVCFISKFSIISSFIHLNKEKKILELYLNLTQED